MRHGTKDEESSPRKEISEGEEGVSGEAFGWVQLWDDPMDVHAAEANLMGRPERNGPAADRRYVEPLAGEDFAGVGFRRDASCRKRRR